MDTLSWRMDSPELARVEQVTWFCSELMLDVGFDLLCAFFWFAKFPCSAFLCFAMLLPVLLFLVFC